MTDTAQDAAPEEAPKNGGRFRVTVDQETAFVNLWRKTGEVLEALPGEIVDLFEGHDVTGDETDDELDAKQAFNEAHAQTIAAHIAQGQLEAAPDAAVDPWPREVADVQVDDEKKLAAEANLAEQVRKDEAAAQLKAAQDAAVAQQKLAQSAAGNSGTDTQENAPTA